MVELCVLQDLVQRKTNRRTFQSPIFSRTIFALDLTRMGSSHSISCAVCLELVRQQASIQAAWSDSNHYRSANAALKEFQARSVKNRSRYDQETSKSNVLDCGQGFP